MKDIELVIFDMDGLMFDTERIAFNSWKEAAGRYGYKVDEELFKKTLGVNLEKTKEIFIRHFGEEFLIDRISEERFAFAEEFIRVNGVPVKEGLYDLLTSLDKLGIKKAVATSTGREKAYRLIKMADIHTCFDCVVCGDEIEKSKPDPDIFLKVAEKLGCSPGKCMVLEDSEAGILAAHRAGMIPVIIPDMKEPGEETKRIIFRQLNNLNEVKELLIEI